MSATAGAALSRLRARLLVFGGRVQGVGYRPFVYRLAHTHNLAGWVRNEGGRVRILVEGAATDLQAFVDELIRDAPPLARPRLVADDAMRPRHHTRFKIRTSGGETPGHIHVPPDQFACDDCLREMRNPRDRRYRYPFVNCTQCGPRYTLIRALPYDRPNTGMADFQLCPDCRAEYDDPLDRRFHAQPLACPACGPRLAWRCDEARIDDNEAAITACIAALSAGAIVAVRGIGGYHLMCDAGNDDAVRRLRERKRRPHKPLAVMVPAAGEDGLGWVIRLGRPAPPQTECLRHPDRPIVLVPDRRSGDLARGDLSGEIAPGLREIGLMLPYSPLHHLLLDDFGRPLVATSGNVSGEPVLTDPGEAQRRLADIADAFLHHDRPILRPADDPVYRSIGGDVPTPLRLGRGNAPIEVPLPIPLPDPVLALGALLKNTVALAWADRAVISPHIGDLGSPRARHTLIRVAADLQELYGVRAGTVVCDAHPAFPARCARELGVNSILPVYHHHAHASALAGEAEQAGIMLVFTWDGIGYGEDGTLWGGEALLGRPGEWRRKASLRPFRLPGGDKAVAQPWRTAASLCWEVGDAWRSAAIADRELDLLRQAWERRINCPLTSSAGRLFDAAAALVGLVHEASFEGHGPQWLETAASTPADPTELPLRQGEDGVWRCDWSPLLPMLADDVAPLAERAARFHASLAQAILDQAMRIHESDHIEVVGLTGGVFQNRRLVEEASTRLEAHGFRVALPSRLPANDAGISYGQAVEAAAMLKGGAPRRLRRHTTRSR